MKTTTATTTTTTTIKNTMLTVTTTRRRRMEIRQILDLTIKTYAHQKHMHQKISPAYADHQ